MADHSVTASTRNFGLDIVRATAIGLVLAAHCMLFFIQYHYTSNEDYRRIFSVFICLGFFGVEIFFVLSGFLIGQLIVKEVLSSPSAHGLVHFWERRWFRTLPPYVLALLLRRATGYPLHWRYFVFLQYFDPQVASGFPISWSLAVEEWFYLLTPLALLAASNRRSMSSRRFFLVCGTIGVVALLGRGAYSLLADPLWDPAVRQHPFLRMDALMIGVLLGGLRVYARQKYDNLARYRRLLGIMASAGLVILGAVLVVEIRTDAIHRSLFMTTVYFDFVSFAVALLILSLESSSRINTGWAAARWSRPIRFISLSSYSLYLFHLSAFEPLLILNSRVRSPTLSWAWMVGALAASVAVASATYIGFEKPLLRLRDRWITPVSIERPAS